MSLAGLCDARMVMIIEGVIPRLLALGQDCCCQVLLKLLSYEAQYLNH